ncbi:hypothetical protein EOD39_3385 [Acipenser ruthenus]|uniref:Uncharacterized protein n=1 Tax=Acipenser ruthenus TaxID=7906 RepID=A0A444UNF8_ACIRT|nr:hypothetical protein EOD39_3385 [Acipenser ruthenus]
MWIVDINAVQSYWNACIPVDCNWESPSSLEKEIEIERLLEDGPLAGDEGLGDRVVPDGAPTWSRGPATGSPDTPAGYLGARDKGPHPLVLDWFTGVVVGAVAEVGSSPPPPSL